MIDLTYFTMKNVDVCYGKVIMWFKKILVTNKITNASANDIYWNVHSCYYKNSNLEVGIVQNNHHTPAATSNHIH